MKYVELGSQGLKVSAQGLGCMGMTATYGPSDEQTSLAVLARACDLGVTLFDTAEVYGPYLNEELLGRFFVGRRHEVAIATKVGFKLTASGNLDVVDGKPVVTGDPKYLQTAVEGSLRRLKSNYIDLLYLHRIDQEIPIEETIGALAKLVTEGKIRFIGLSEASAQTIRRAHAVHPIAAVQTEYSLFERAVERNGVLAATRELSIGFVSYSPLGRGLLSGRISNVDELSSTDFRRSDPRFQGSNLLNNLKLVARVREIASLKGVTPSQLALAWTMHAQAVPIPGTQRVKYVEENVSAATVTMTDNDLEELNAAAPIGATSGNRYAKEIMETIDG